MEPSPNHSLSSPSARLDDAQIVRATRSLIKRAVLRQEANRVRGVTLLAAAVLPWAVVLIATGNAVLAFLAYVLPAAAVEIVLVRARRRYWRVASMLYWLGPVTARFEAARAARLVSTDTATAEERHFDLVRAAVLEQGKPGDPDFQATHDAAARLPEDERSYQLGSLGLALALIAERRGYDFMPYLVLAADEVSDVRPRPWPQVLLWLLRWWNVVTLCLFGLLLAVGVAARGHVQIGFDRS